MKHRILALVAMTVSLSMSATAVAQGRTVARLFWQDDSSASVRYGDLKKSADGWTLDPQAVAGFPLFDVAEQSLVQMQSDSGIILLGVHDHSDGTAGSGWVAIDSGAVEESHGDHSHWHFKQLPNVLKSIVDANQGNPAHVYKYGNVFVLANDKKNGFTLTSAASIRHANTADSAATFYEGGNGHITLAVIDGQVAYATWIARNGDDKGRIDVVGLGDNKGKRYSIHCPSGGLHGATINSGKVFFAPSDGICWVAADREVDDSPESVLVHHLSIGKDSDDNPLRTGAFTNLENTVLFTSGKGGDARLCWIDATRQSPEVQTLRIELSEGDSLSTPFTIKTRAGKRLALMLRENQDAPETDSLLVVSCDHDRNGQWEDTVLVNTIPVGRNQVQGHAGHHGIALLPGGREVIISNPADATLSVISLRDYTVEATLSVDGVPTRLLSIGG